MVWSGWLWRSLRRHGAWDVRATVASKTPPPPPLDRPRQDLTKLFMRKLLLLLPRRSCPLAELHGRRRDLGHVSGGIILADRVAALEVVFLPAVGTDFPLALLLVELATAVMPFLVGVGDLGIVRQLLVGDRGLFEVGADVADQRDDLEEGFSDL